MHLRLQVNRDEPECTHISHQNTEPKIKINFAFHFCVRLSPTHPRQARAGMQSGVAARTAWRVRYEAISLCEVLFIFLRED
jgi:hypothetical protein